MEGLKLIQDYPLIFTQFHMEAHGGGLSLLWGSRSPRLLNSYTTDEVCGSNGIDKIKCKWMTTHCGRAS